MDKIIIQGLQVFALVGVYDWEREAKQALTVDVTLTLDLTKAAQSDDVKDTVDYAAVATLLDEVAGKSSFQLLEALANAMSNALFATYPLLRVTLRLSKPEILDNARFVAIEISREA